MPWQIQARPKSADNAEWEPITLERAKLVSGVAYHIGWRVWQRRYQYETLEEAKRAFREYVEVEGGLPNLLVRMATGSEKFTDKYEVQFVELRPEDDTPEDDADLQRWQLQGALAKTRGELDAANQHVKILEAERNSAIAACLWSCARTIHANCLNYVAASNYLKSYADSVQSNYTIPTPTASGPGGFAAVPPGSESALREDGPRWKLGANHRMLAALKTLVNAIDPNTDPDPRGTDELLRIGRAAIKGAFDA